MPERKSPPLPLSNVLPIRKEPRIPEPSWFRRSPRTPATKKRAVSPSIPSGGETLEPPTSTEKSEVWALGLEAGQNQQQRGCHCQGPRPMRHPGVRGRLHAAGIATAKIAFRFPNPSSEYLWARGSVIQVDPSTRNMYAWTPG